MAKYKYGLSFEECEENGDIKRNDLIRKSELQGTALLSLFRNYKYDTIEMCDFVAILNNSNFQVAKVTYNIFNNEYVIYSPSGNIELNLTVSKTNYFKNKDKEAHTKTLEILSGMKKDDVVEVNNNTTSISDNVLSSNENRFDINNKTSLRVIEGGKKNIRVFMPSVRKLFKEKPKLAIALCTLASIATVAAGGFIIKTVVDRIEDRKFIDKFNNYSNQADQSFNEVTPTVSYYQSKQAGEIDDSLDSNGVFEEYKKGYNEENYQNVR